MAVASFEKFRAAFPNEGSDVQPAYTIDPQNQRLLNKLPASYAEFLEQAPPLSPRSNVIRFLTPGTKPSLAGWNSSEGLHHGWPGLESRLIVFAYDWLGRQLGFDLKANMNITRLDPGSGEFDSIPVDFTTFVNSLLVDSPDDVLSEGLYKEWLAAGNPPPKFDQCVGYKVPLFKGGNDDFNNMETCDLEVYTSIMGQVYTKSSAKPQRKIFGIKIGW